MKKNLLRLSVWAATLLMASTLTSCVTETDETPAAAASGDGQLVININSTPVGSTTRSTDFNSVTDATEKTVSNLVVGVFRPSADGTNPNAVVEITTLSGLSADLSAGALTEVTNTARATGATALSIQADDVVLAVCNVPADIVTDLKAATTADGFRQTAFSIDNALIFNNDDDGAYANGGTPEAPATMPMYGEGTVAVHGTISGAFTTTITVRHMVAKVTLNQVKLVTTDANVQFTPEQVFLTHVAGSADFYYSDYSTLTYGFHTTPTKYYQGESTNDGSDNTKLYRDYLSTPALTVSALTSASGTYSTKHVLYAMPSTLTTDEGATRLVLKGTWNDGTNSSPVYYPIKLTTVTSIGGTGAVSIQPNSHYIIDLVIKRAGSNSADTDLPSTNVVTATIQHVDWSTQAVTSTFDSTGGDPTTTY